MIDENGDLNHRRFFMARRLDIAFRMWRSTRSRYADANDARAQGGRSSSFINQELNMSNNTPLLAGQKIVRVCLFLIAAIAMSGGALQMFLGQPDTSPRLDNVHRFMAGVYFSTGLINFWAAVTIRRQGTLVYLLAVGILIAGCGRLLSIHTVGLPQPAAVWLGYLIPELLLPFVVMGAHYASRKVVDERERLGS